mmetsp:Transcript_13042/g.31679  ORF Transcript_13042/g.31679 Transcript_13042/m.31679 type:complete len:296 (+) Transcript_13042:261-1148(+)
MRLTIPTETESTQRRTPRAPSPLRRPGLGRPSTAGGARRTRAPARHPRAQGAPQGWHGPGAGVLDRPGRVASAGRRKLRSRCSQRRTSSSRLCASSRCLCPTSRNPRSRGASSPSARCRCWRGSSRAWHATCASSASPSPAASTSAPRATSSGISTATSKISWRSRRRCGASGPRSPPRASSFWGTMSTAGPTPSKWSRIFSRTSSCRPASSRSFAATTRPVFRTATPGTTRHSRIRVWLSSAQRWATPSGSLSTRSSTLSLSQPWSTTPSSASTEGFRARRRWGAKTWRRAPQA